MRPPYDRPPYSGSYDWRPAQEWRHPVSDAWVFGDAVITIVVSLLTIAFLILRHPVRVLATIVLVAMLGTIAGWW